MLDRIDYNIEHAEKNTKQANVHLEKTLEIEKSAKARGCLICLLIAVVITLIILIIKWT